jgi:hypothetical protein
LVDKVNHSTYSAQKTRVNSTSDYGDNRTLDVTVLTTSHLLDMRNTVTKMATADMGVETFETTIKLNSTYRINAPLKGMVIEELVTGVKYLWHKKIKGIGQKPITPEQQVYPTKTELLPSLCGDSLLYCSNESCGTLGTARRRQIGWGKPRRLRRQRITSSTNKERSRVMLSCAVNREVCKWGCHKWTV